MAVPVGTGAALVPGVPMPLFEMPRLASAFFSYDVGADGRFLINAADDAAEGGKAPIRVVLNWTALLTP